MAFFVSNFVRGPSLETSTRSTHPRTDVYSYNFPEDPRSLKVLGSFLGSFSPLVLSILCAAYFVLALETAQTALTGADVYYWFVAGYGDVGRLAHSHFAPIDISIMTVVVSLIVQGYFCFRIWRMSRRLSWICWAVTVVCIHDNPHINQASDVFLSLECDSSIYWGGVGGYRS
jgi:hypothetical protein